MHILAQAPVAQRLAAGIDHLDAVRLDQLIQVPLQGPAAGGFRSRAIDRAEHRQQAAAIRAIGGGRGGPGQEGLQPAEAVDTALGNGAHGHSIGIVDKACRNYGV